mmetsp:Transcript_26777/g.54808  ORF Transcript_26777/g.54808 Transcript_26777/m.54808 type:complete len:112 (-) Transcript_26777:273-608(-)|eukprot:CAMPEP_0183301128 /NCGR_PEP_ID=MMETSP0160_2-20130417/7336_1 /TAXON_ID=2839 ORGANISM="Odontella Sinensis, Strain Grunow 1884" /NCGR_SAMPLE_ID=MMETSP0160_2 /ASSEMBLY_ACC=CAM_ASM_000250 /LENGTH=111 /DNA_ID=CAMNT_0025463677 /DNA_START=109 /DNA_END=444 /DNA_ORIENTATION=-
MTAHSLVFCAALLLTVAIRSTFAEAPGQVVNAIILSEKKYDASRRRPFFHSASKSNVVMTKSENETFERSKQIQQMGQQIRQSQTCETGWPFCPPGYVSSELESLRGGGMV